MIILSSYGFDIPIMAEKFKEYIPCPQNKTVLFVPFAGFNPLYGLAGRVALMNFGFQKSNVFILDANNVEKARNRSFDYIYVSSGDTFKLLSELQEINFLDDIVRMVNSGSTYIGASAGAILTSSNIEYAKKLEDDNYDLSDYSGLGILYDCIVPHIDQCEISTVIACKSVCYGRNLLGIRNDAIHIIEGAK